jgi:hypothetical protein
MILFFNVHIILFINAKYNTHHMCMQDEALLSCFYILSPSCNNPHMRVYIEVYATLVVEIEEAFTCMHVFCIKGI